MKISVAICTWNRADLLTRTLSGLTTQRLPQGLDWEVVVVNNNCTDRTDEVIASFQAQLPLHRVWEPVPGLSNARNAAIKTVTGDYITWTDDDVLVDAEWVSAYHTAFLAHPDAAFFGGPIDPWFEGEAPDWVLKAWSTLEMAFIARDFGPQPFPLTAKRLPFGANLAVRTPEQRRHLFDTRHGRRPDGHWVGGEEIRMMKELLADGETGWWVPGARVKHWIPKSRQTLRYVRLFFEGSGRTRALTQTLSGRAKLAGRPLWLWRQAIEQEMRYRLLRLRGDPGAWAPALVDAAVTWGVLKGHRA